MTTQNAVEVLRQLSGGRTLDKLSSAITDAVQAIREHGGKGVITLTLAIAANDDDSVAIVGTVKSKVPEGAAGKSIFFDTADGRLVRTDPRQQEIFTDVKQARGGSAEDRGDLDRAATAGAR